MKYAVKTVYAPFLLLIDFIGSICFFWTKFYRLPKSPKKILVIRLDHAGDMVMTTPLFRALKEHFPESKIAVLCRPFVKDLLETNKNVDEVYFFEPPWFNRGESLRWFNTASFLLKLRKANFDIVIEPHADPRNIFSAFLIGGFRIGFGVRGFGFLLNKVLHYNAAIHAIKKNLAFAEFLGADGDEKLDVVLAGADKMFAKKLSAKNKLDNFVIFYVGAGRHEKYWQTEKWVELCGRILDNHSLKIVLCGFGADKDICDKIIVKLPKVHRNRVVNLCSKIIGFRKLAVFIAQSKLLVSTDTVCIHLASALKVPQVELFGPTNPDIWGYVGKLSIPIYKLLHDSCGNDCRKEAHRMQMMKEISVSDVFFAVKKLL